MLRVLEKRRDQHAVVLSTPSLGAPPLGTIRWVDVQGADASDLDALRGAFAFDSLAIQNCIEYGLLSKIDDYGDYLFGVLHAVHPSAGALRDVAAPELHFFLGPGYLVTVHDQTLPELEAVWQRIPADAKAADRGAGWILVQLVQSLASCIELVADDLAEHADALERDAIAGTLTDLSGMLALKRSAAFVHRVLRPMRDAITALSRHTDDLIDVRSIAHMRDLADWVARLDETIVAAKDSVGAAMSAHHSLLATRTNDTMKKLTVFSAIFLPLGLIVGFWGQNFQMLPIGSHVAYSTMWASLVAVPVGVLLWVRKWL